MKTTTLNVKASSVDQLTDLDLQQCYQCGKCTAGCPAAFAMDIAPNQIVRLMQLGLWQEAIQSETIWLCATCSTCSTRCPKGFDLAKLMDNLRVLAQKQGVELKYRGKKVAVFNQLFLDTVNKYGRSYEMGLILKYNMFLRNPFKDAMMGINMLSQGKLKIVPHKINGTKEVVRIMENVKKLEVE